jgi:hypothetical protein
MEETPPMCDVVYEKVLNGDGGWGQKRLHKTVFGFSREPVISSL